MSLNVKPAFGEEGSATGEIFETKFVVPRAIAEILKSTISRNAVKPPRFHSARLKTTYFDDASGTSFFESRDGHLSKKKYRLRTYMDPDPEGALYSIEVKRRSDARTGKVKRLIYKPLPPGYAPTTFRDLIATSEDMDGRTFADLRRELPERELYPDTVIYYERLRFDDTRFDVRYNLDTKIKVFVRPGTDDTDGGGGGGVTLDHDIFEIKSARPGFFPDFLSALGLEPVSFSKFVWGRQSFLGEF